MRVPEKFGFDNSFAGNTVLGRLRLQDLALGAVFPQWTRHNPS